VAQKLHRLFDHAPNFQQHFDFPNAHRTSNMADRLIDFQDRLLYRTHLTSFQSTARRLTIKRMKQRLSLARACSSVHSKFLTKFLPPLQNLLMPKRADIIGEKTD
jgi:hypothetical protein